MKIQIFSDIHLEINPDPISFLEKLKCDCDVLIMAGDIMSHNMIGKIMPVICSNYKNIIYVAGNHEFYETKREKLIKNMRAMQELYDNFIFLDKEIAIIDGQRFLGTTLWFGKNRLPKQAMMNDFSRIKNFNWVYQENKYSIEFLKNNLLEDDIVITHHLPSSFSIRDEFKDDPYNPFYVTDLTDLIKERSPKIWFHGHSHLSCNYLINKTKIISNPFGYYNIEYNNEFDYNKIIDL